MRSKVLKSAAVKGLGSVLVASLLALGSLAGTARGDITYAPTKHSAFQAVFEDGTPRWPGEGNIPGPIQLVGVVINNPSDMLDYTASSDPRWQVFIQAIEPDDFGGTALYMMRDSVKGPAYYYEPAEWTSEMNRLNYANGTTPDAPLQVGDVVVVQAAAPGLFFNGKYNVNEQHMKSPDYDFTITVTQRGVTPQATPITLADLKTADDKDFLFDDTRARGCEHYQGSLVHLEDLLLVDPENWGLGGTVTIKQGEGASALTFSMRLGLDPDLGTIDADGLTFTPFGVTAILDQESPDPTSGYRLWLTNADNLNAEIPNMVPEPSAVVLGMSASLLGILALRRRNTRSTV